jgi:psp operon transcriptional activator
LRRPFFAGFTADAKAALLAYSWPGNVRELKNAIERSVYRSETVDQPIGRILFDPFASPYSPAPAEEPPSEVAETAPAPSAQEHAVPADFRGAVANFERQVLRRALERAQFKQTVAAKLLGLSYHQFRSLLRKHGLAKQAADNDD